MVAMLVSEKKKKKKTQILKETVTRDKDTT